MDTQVKRIRPSDYELSTVQENLATTLQQVLDFLNKAPANAASLQQTLTPLLAQVRGPGTPQSMTGPALLVHGDPTNSAQNVVQIGDPATATASAVGAQVGIIGAVGLTGPLTVTGDTVINGNVFIKARSVNGVVIQPPASGPAFYITNVAGNAALFLVYADGSVQSNAGISAANLTSSAGICTTIDCGHYWNTSTPANTYLQTQKVVINQNGGGTGLTQFVYKFPRAGSIVGYSLNNAGPINSMNYVAYYKNGVQISNIAVGAGANNATFWNTHVKGTYLFAAGDTLTTYVGIGAAGNYQASLILTLEMSA